MKIKKFIPLAFLFLTSFIDNPDQADKKTIMAIFAHPDDETTISPLLAKYANEGHNVYLVIATKGEMGVTRHANIPAGDSLASTRAREAACVCEKLGIKDPVLLGLGDGSLAKDFTGRVLHEKLDSIFKLYKPDIVVTWGPDGGYGHMDHRIVHNVVTELFQSGDYLKPEKLFYSGMPTETRTQKPSFQTNEIKWMSANWKTVKKEYLTMRIRCNKQEVANSEAALLCHKSQFSDDQMKDIKLWMSNASRDTVYLRPFIPLKKITFDLFY